MTHGIAANCMMTAVIYAPGPNWISGIPVTAQNLTTHQQYMKELHESGKLVSAGPFLDELSGGMAILQLADSDETNEIIRNDPAVREGVLKASLRPWYIVVPLSAS